VMWSATTDTGTHASCWPEDDPAAVVAIVTHELDLAGVPDVVVSAEVVDHGGA
jgi:hypothetical protein